jgi:hypothetical protein
MAKKGAAAAAELTNRQVVENLANTVLELETKKSEIEQLIKDHKAEILKYVEETGERDLGALVVEQRQGKPKLDFGNLTPKQKKFVLENLSAALPDFMVTSSELDVEKLYFAMPGNLTVQNALKANNIAIVQEATWAFKKVGVTA